MSAGENSRRGGQSRGRTASRRGRRLQQQNQSRQAIAEQRQQLAEDVGINADPQEDVVVDRGGEGVTVRLTDSAEKQRLAKQFSQETGAEINPSDVQLTDDGAELSATAEDRIARQEIDDLRGDVDGSIVAPPSGSAFSALTGTFRSELSSGRIENIGQYRQATDAGLTADPVTAVEKANPSAVADVFGDRFIDPEEQVEQAQEEIDQRRQLLENDPSQFLATIQENQQAFGDAALSLENAFRQGQSRRRGARQAEDSIADEIADTETDLSADQVSVDVDPQTGDVNETAVSDEFKQEQQQEFRGDVAEQAGVSASVIDVEQDGDQLSATVDEQAFAAEVAEDEGVSADAVTVEERDGELAALVETNQQTTQQQDTTDLRGGEFIDELPQSDLTVEEGEGPVFDPEEQDEPTFPRDNINQTLVNQTTDSGGFLSENRSVSGGVIPSAIVTEQDTQALAETGQDIIDETQDADIDPATPAGALFTEASGVNLGEGVTRGVGQFVGGALAAPQAFETATEFTQNAPLEQESVDTASAVAQSATRSTVNQAVTDPVAFGTGIGIGAVTGTAATRGVSAVGGRVSSARQVVSMDFDEFRGTSRGQLDLTGRQERQTVDLDDTDAGRPVPDDINEQRLISSEDPRRTAGEVGRQRAVDRDIEADTPDLEDRGQPSGQSAEVRSVDRPDSVSTQDLNVADAGRGADRVLDPDTSDFTATERLEARNIGLDLADPDFPRLSDRADVPGLSENPVRAGRATADTGPSAATVTDDVAAAATVTEAGEAASSARQPEGERVGERVPEEPTTTDDTPAGIVTGSPTLTGSQTPTTGQTLLESAQTGDLSATSQASAVAVGSAVGSLLDSRLSATPLTEAAGAQDTRPAVGAGVGLGIDTTTGTVSRSQSEVDVGTAADTATATTPRPASDTAATTRRDTTSTGTTGRLIATSGFAAPTTTAGTPPTAATATPPTTPGPRQTPESGEDETRGVDSEDDGLISGDLDDEDFGVPQPGWFAETLQARAFGGLTQRGVADEQAQAASIGLGLPTERVAEAEGQDQQQLELAAGQLGLDLFEGER